jgi:hypothetical protein
MERKMRLSSRSVSFFTLLAIGGCAQVIGLSDYKVDPSLDGKAGKSSTGGEGGDGGSSAGKTSIPPGGEDTGGSVALGGGGQGGEPAGVAGAPAGGEGGAGGGVLVPCDSLDCCTKQGGHAVGTEIITDVGFEGGPVEEGNMAWTEESTKSLEIITPTDTDGTGLGFKSHAGMYYAYLSGLAGEESTIYTPNFTVPKDAGWMTLTGYRIFQIDTQDATNDDFAGIALYDPAETDPVELPFFWGAPPAHPDGWADKSTWTKFEESWDALPHQGKKRYLGIRGSSDMYSTDPDLDSSSFLFDDVSLKVYRCYQ